MVTPHPGGNSTADERINWSWQYIVDNTTNVLSVTGHLISAGIMDPKDLEHVKRGDTDGTTEAMNCRFLGRLQKLPVRTRVDKYTALLAALRKSGDDHVAQEMEKISAERLASKGAGLPSTTVQVEPGSGSTKREAGQDNITASPVICSSPAKTVTPCTVAESGMHRYSRKGDIKRLRHLIDKCSGDVNARDSKGRTPLFYAAEQGNHNVVVFLTTQNADVKVADKARGWTALHFACEHGFDKIATVLLNKGADVNAVGLKGQTPLYVACTNSKETKTSRPKETVNLLLKWKARVDLARSDETTPLMAAAGIGNAKIVEALLSERSLEPPSSGSTSTRGEQQKGSKKPQVLARNHRGETALHFACIYGHLRAVELLVQHHAPVDCQSVAGLTPLYCASQAGRGDVVSLLLKNGAATTVDVATKEGVTPLYIASEKGHTEVVKLLISANAQINFQKARTKHTSLITAVNNGNKPVVEALLEKEADVNVQNKAGWTPLHAACYNGNTEVAVLLFDGGAEVNVKDKEGATPLHLACYHGQSETTLTERLLLRNAEVHAVDTQGRTPLHDSCLHPHKDISALLIEHGADVSVEDAHGKTALHYASGNGYADLTELLVSQGAAVNGKDKSGDTPLHLACQNGHTEVAEKLVHNGAEPGIQNVQGDIPLHCAIKNEHFDTYESLMFFVKDMNVQNRQGQSPLSLARERSWI